MSWVTRGLQAASIQPSTRPEALRLTQADIVRYDTHTQSPGELRPRPFCAHEQPLLTVLGDERLRFVLVMCPECGALGPRATGDDSPGHAVHLWNLRYGAHGPVRLPRFGTLKPNRVAGAIQ